MLWDAEAADGCLGVGTHMYHVRRHVIGLVAFVLPLLALSAAFRGAIDRRPLSATSADSAPDSLRVWLELPSEVTSGASVPITLRIENSTEQSIELYLRGRTITFDVRVWNAAGELVWERLANEIIPAIIALTVLAPGASVESRTQWDQRTNRGDLVPPGRYTVWGSLLTDAPKPIETATVPLSIVRK